MNEPVYVPCNNCALEWPTDGTFGEMHGDPENGYYCPVCFPLHEWEEGRQPIDAAIICTLLNEMFGGPEPKCGLSGFTERISDTRIVVNTTKNDGPFTIIIEQGRKDEPQCMKQ